MGMEKKIFTSLMTVEHLAEGLLICSIGDTTPGPMYNECKYLVTFVVGCFQDPAGFCVGQTGELNGTMMGHHSVILQVFKSGPDICHFSHDAIHFLICYIACLSVVGLGRVPLDLHAIIAFISQAKKRMRGFCQLPNMFISIMHV